jgi:hypothetical protein
MANWLVLFVQSRMQKFADSEVGSGPARDFDRIASFWVPARARLAMPDREGTEASDLDSISPSKCIADGREDGFNNAFNIAVLEMWVQLCHPSHQFRLRRDSPPPCWPRIYRAGQCRE